MAISLRKIAQVDEAMRVVGLLTIKDIYAPLGAGTRRIAVRFFLKMGTN